MKSILRYFFFLATLLGGLSSCQQVKQEIYLNPDGSGKVVLQAVEKKSSMDMGMGGQSANGDANSRYQELLSAARKTRKIIEDSKGVEAWKDVSYSVDSAGSYTFSGTAYFPNIEKLELNKKVLNFPVSHFSSSEFAWFDEPKHDKAPENQEQVIKQLTQNVKGMAMMAGALRKVYVDYTIHFPYKIKKAMKGDKLSSYDYHVHFNLGELMNKFSDFAQDQDKLEAFLRKENIQGKNDKRMMNAIYPEGIKVDFKHGLFSGKPKTYFNYQKEVSEISDKFPEIREPEKPKPPVFNDLSNINSYNRGIPIQHGNETDRFDVLAFGGGYVVSYNPGMLIGYRMKDNYSGFRIKNASYEKGGIPTFLSVSPDGRWALAYDDYQKGTKTWAVFSMYDLSRRKMLYQETVPFQHIRNIKWISGDKILFATDGKFFTCNWDGKTLGKPAVILKETSKIKGFYYANITVDTSENHSVIVAYTPDYFVKFNLENPQESLERIPVPVEGFFNTFIHSNSSGYYALADRKGLYILNPDLSVKDTLSGFMTGNHIADFSPDGTHIITIDKNKMSLLDYDIEKKDLYVEIKHVGRQLEANNSPYGLFWEGNGKYVFFPPSSHYMELGK